MGKAEERALEAYPSTPNWDERITCMYRGGFLRGYYQAEKDLELTWEDIATIEKLGDDLVKQNQTPMSDEEFYKEVLKQFKEFKKKLSIKKISYEER